MGDQEAAEALFDLWADIAHQFPIACFLCRREIARPPVPRTAMIPDLGNKNGSTVIGAPLCAVCAALPPMQRYGRVMQTFRRMTGIRAHFEKPSR